MKEKIRRIQTLYSFIFTVKGYKILINFNKQLLVKLPRKLESVTIKENINIQTLIILEEITFQKQPTNQEVDQYCAWSFPYRSTFQFSYHIRLHEFEVTGPTSKPSEQKECLPR